MQTISTLKNFCLPVRFKHNFSRLYKRHFGFRKASDRSGMTLAPKSYNEIPKEDRMLPGLLKCYIFTVGFCGTVFIGASICNYERVKNQFNDNGFKTWVMKEWNKVEGWEHKEGELRRKMNKWWNDIPEGRKICWCIIAINIFVFSLWRIPALQGTMLQYFCSSPAAKAVCWPLLLSSFSHYAPLHLGINMYVLHSFSSAICSTMGPEQFVAFYLAGGVIASLAGQTLKVATRTSGVSLGASGAIMALLGYFCSRYPDAQLGIVFLPQFPFSAEMAIKCVMCLDAAGIIFRWKLFDHAAHLGGAIFGVFYAKIGESYVWSRRNLVYTKWESFCKTCLGKGTRSDQ